jgi:hypothetical protein
VSFDLVEITRTTNPLWFRDGAEYNMKNSLRKGGYDTLNIYLQGLGDGLLGYAYFPVQNPGVSEFVNDGVSVLYTSLPGGGEVDYDLGKTLTHEAGHWYVDAPSRTVGI